MLVKATQHVKDRLERQIYNLADGECKTHFGKPVIELLSDMRLGANTSTILDDLYWGEHLQYRDKLPVAWFNELSSGSHILLSPDTGTITAHNFYQNHRIGRTYTYGADAFRVLAKEVRADNPAFIVRAPKNMLLPPDGNTYAPCVKVSDWNRHPELRAAYDKAVAILKIVDKWRAIHAKILEFFDSTKSVNEAVKLWPELAGFLDPEDRQRLQKEGTTKKSRESRIDKAKEVLASLNTQAIVADVVGIKLSAA